MSQYSGQKTDFELFVTRYPFTYTLDDVKNIFTKVQVVGGILHQKSETSSFCFLSLESREEVEKAIQLYNNAVIGNSHLTVREGSKNKRDSEGASAKHRVSKTPGDRGPLPRLVPINQPEESPLPRLVRLNQPERRERYQTPQMESLSLRSDAPKQKKPDQHRGAGHQYTGNRNSRPAEQNGFRNGTDNGAFTSTRSVGTTIPEVAMNDYSKVARLASSPFSREENQGNSTSTWAKIVNLPKGTMQSELCALVSPYKPSCASIVPDFVGVPVSGKDIALVCVPDATVSQFFGDLHLNLYKGCQLKVRILCDQ